MTLAPDDRWMQLALEQAAGLASLPRPNPRVGAVIVKEGQVLGLGATRQAGGDHAEIIALREALAQSRDLSTATLYVTLEPCNHYGRTPPCSQALINAGIRRVVIASRDPHPSAQGGGANLQAAGCEVLYGVAQDSARALNPGFFQRLAVATNPDIPPIERPDLAGMPFVRLKIATSIDGATALQNGSSQWITGPRARADAQRFRANSCALLTGIGTVLADDPQLTVRPAQLGISAPGLPWVAPQRIVIDPHLAIPPSARLLQGEPLWLAVGGAAAASPRARQLEQQGHRILECGSGDGGAGRIDLKALLRQLGQAEINELLVEAGSKLNTSFLRQRLFNELVVYMAPTLLGQGRPWSEWALQNLEEGVRLDLLDIAWIAEEEGGGCLRLQLRPQ